MAVQTPSSPIHAQAEPAAHCTCAMAHLREGTAAFASGIWTGGSGDIQRGGGGREREGEGERESKSKQEDMCALAQVWKSDTWNPFSHSITGCPGDRTQVFRLSCNCRHQRVMSLFLELLETLPPISTWGYRYVSPHLVYTVLEIKPGLYSLPPQPHSRDMKS